MMGAIDDILMKHEGSREGVGLPRDKLSMSPICWLRTSVVETRSMFCNNFVKVNAIFIETPAMEEHLSLSAHDLPTLLSVVQSRANAPGAARLCMGNMVVTRSRTKSRPRYSRSF